MSKFANLNSKNVLSRSYYTLYATHAKIITIYFSKSKKKKKEAVINIWTHRVCVEWNKFQKKKHTQNKKTKNRM